MVANSAHTTHGKLELPTWRVIINFGIVVIVRGPASFDPWTGTGPLTGGCESLFYTTVLQWHQDSNLRDTGQTPRP
ncbi:hypothetical protein TNCV_1693331 [Trichonephila clavipes]|nr:hypothetical protein TNCV_1693331 [Trichonephila clavipes]